MSNPFLSAEAITPSPERKRNMPPPVPEKAKQESQTRQLLLQALEAYEDDPKTALELLASQKNATQEKGAEQLQIALLKKAYGRLDQLDTKLNASVAESPKNIRQALIDIMQALEDVSRALPAERPEWNTLTGRFDRILKIKSGSSKEVSKIFSEVFDQFNDFIEDEFVMREIKSQKDQGGVAYFGDIMEKTYGRTKEEIEEIKIRNREQSVAQITELKEKPYVSFEDITALHRTNNRGIVPKSTSRMRGEGELATFGEKGRFGTLSEDLPEEIKLLDGRIEDLIDKSIVGNMSDAQYEIGIAKLHNDILDMHPFGDRNGSTALLFIELMMARRGYEPPKTREKNYYKALGKALDYNPVALSIVGYEQYKIGYEAGYFEGEAVKKKKDKYEKVLRIIKGLKQKEQGAK